jgi:hypothetical protein
MNIVSWNAGLDSLCSNIIGAVPSWGSIICLSPPGGGYVDDLKNSTTVIGNGNSAGRGGAGDGYAEHRANRPAGVVAASTTSDCGHYIQAKSGDDCAILIAKELVPMDLFIRANPSLVSAASCSAKLLANTWYCLRPVRTLSVPG